MVILSNLQMIEEATSKKISFTQKEPTIGVTRRAEPFRKIHATFKESDPLHVFFLEVKCFGLREFAKSKTTKRFSLKLLLEGQNLVAFEKIQERLQRKAEKLLLGESFEKFSPLLGETPLCRVPFDPSSKVFFSKFTDKKNELISPDEFRQECLVDVAIAIKGVYASGGMAFLEVDLLQARKRKNCLVRSFLPPLQDDEEEHQKNYGSPVEDLFDTTDDELEDES